MIDRDAIEILKGIQNNLEETLFLERCAIDMGIKALEEQRPRGEWKKRTIGYLSTHECSNCDFNGDWLWNFCPNCGAKMQKEW